jgi:hypothetical protein
LRWIGAMSTRNALLALVAGTLIGIIGTLVSGSEPGVLLSLFIFVGAIVATLGVRPGAVYLFFPLPAFAFFAGALITGKIHDSSLSSSTAGLAAGFTQWIAGIFLPMCAATILVLVIGGARWLLARQLVGGQFPMSEGRPGTSRSPRPRPAAPASRPDADSWTDQQAPRTRPGPRPGKAPWPGPDGARSARPARDDRDPWNDPRPTADPRTAADRRPPGRNVPPVAPQPAFRPRPANPGAPGPGDPRAQRPPAPPRPAPPRPAPQRPSRPPQNPWDQR